MGSAFAGVLTAIMASSPACSAELLLNGGFESGTFGAWNAASRAPANGLFAIDSDNSVNLTSLPTPGPAAGGYYAVSDQIDAASYILWQAFTVPAGSSVSVSYELFSNSYAPIAIGAADLDHTAPSANQHLRVDVIALGDFTSNNYRTSGSMVNLLIGGTAISLGDPSSPWASYSHDVSGFAGGGGSFVLRYGVVANQDVFNLGVDAVRITVSPIPEASTVAAAGFVAICAVARVIRRRTAG